GALRAAAIHLSKVRRAASACPCLTTVLMTSTYMRGLSINGFGSARLPAHRSLMSPMERRGGYCMDPSGINPFMGLEGAMDAEPPSPARPAPRVTGERDAKA